MELEHPSSLGLIVGSLCCHSARAGSEGTRGWGEWGGWAFDWRQGLPLPQFAPYQAGREKQAQM